MHAANAFKCGHMYVLCVCVAVCRLDHCFEPYTLVTFNPACNVLVYDHTPAKLAPSPRLQLHLLVNFIN